VSDFRLYDFETRPVVTVSLTRKIEISIFSYQKVRSVLIVTHLATLNYCLLDYRIATPIPVNFSHLSFILEITYVFMNRRFFPNRFRVKYRSPKVKIRNPIVVIYNERLLYSPKIRYFCRNLMTDRIEYE
jgi:hypothetical protein